MRAWHSFIHICFRIYEIFFFHSFIKIFVSHINVCSHVIPTTWKLATAFLQASWCLRAGTSCATTTRTSIVIDGCHTVLSTTSLWYVCWNAYLYSIFYAFFVDVYFYTIVIYMFRYINGYMYIWIHIMFFSISYLCLIYPIRLIPLHIPKVFMARNRSSLPSSTRARHRRPG